VVNAFIAYIFLEARDYDSAVDAALKALEFDAAAPLPYFPLGRAHAKLDDFRRAIEALAEALRLGGSVPRFEASLGFAYARAGERAEAEAILDRFSRGPLASVVSPVERALVALGLGDTNAALCDLEAPMLPASHGCSSPEIRSSRSLEPSADIAT
jgi:tetratricopeptide (TPR) repeat protein